MIVPEYTALMAVNIGSGLAVLVYSPDKWVGAIINALPAAAALWALTPTLEGRAVGSLDPWSPILLLPVALHVLFFGLESVAFPWSRAVQAGFIGGRRAKDAGALAVSKRLLFQQGVASLLLRPACFPFIFNGSYFPLLPWCGAARRQERITCAWRARRRGRCACARTLWRSRRCWPCSWAPVWCLRRRRHTRGRGPSCKAARPSRPSRHCVGWSRA